jgi:hypothetical protein
VYDEHNAKEDALTLQKAVACCKRPAEVMAHNFQISAVIQEIERDTSEKNNINSLQPLLDQKVCGFGTMRRIAASGLSFEHIKLAFSRNYEYGIQRLFGEHQWRTYRKSMSPY